MDWLGGYRIVRKLGEGPRAELLLACADGDRVDTGGDTGSEDMASVTLKHYRDGVSDESISTEIEALARSAGDHSVELLDVTSASSGSLALILDRLPGGSLGRLLGLRPTLELGELPTILAPLGALVDRVHAAGVVHRGIRLESVLFDGAGAPVLACFGRAELIEPGLPPASLEGLAAVHADQRALASVAAAVLDRAEDRQAVRDLAEWMATSVDEPHAGWGTELATRALELAPPLPVDFTPQPVALELRVPARLPFDEPPTSDTRRLRRPTPQQLERRRPKPAVAARRPRDRVERREPTPTSEPRQGVRAAAKPALDAAGAPDWVTALIPGDWLARVRASLAAVRVPVWIAAGAVGIALVAAIILVPQADSGAVADAEPTTSPTPTFTAAPEDLGPIEGDDPVLALVALLAARNECLHDLSVLCLDAVGQVESSALDDDQRLIRSLQDGAESPGPFLVDAEQVTLAERLGDTALLELDGVAETQPASILVMRTEAGWRIRDYLE